MTFVFNWFHMRRAISAGLFAAVVAVYFQVWNFELVDYDDLLFLTRNPYIRGSIGWVFRGYAANWAPLTWLSYIGGYHLYGFSAGWHHLTNVLLHALATVFFFLAFYEMTGAKWPSAFVAFAFGLHPLHVEAVAWVAERKEVLSGLFWALSLLAWVFYCKKPHFSRFCAVLSAFLCGLLAKPMIVTLPFVLLLLDYWPLERFRKLAVSRLMVEKIPFLVLSAIVSVITFVVQRGGGAISTLDQVPIGARIENAAVSYAVYVLKFLWPTNLAVIYPFDSGLAAWAVVGSAAALIAITAVVMRKPPLAVGWFWFLGTLVPVIGLVQIGMQSRADRYMYIPLIGLAIVAAWGVPRTAILAIPAVIWAGMTWVQIGYWRDTVTLFEHAIQVTDRNWLAMSGLSHTLIDRGRLDEAEPYLQESLRLRPNLPEARISAGAALSKRGNFPAAEQQFRIALQLSPNDPDAREGLGVALIEQQRFAEAEEHLLAALKIRPDDGDTHYNLGRLYGLSGRPDRAIEEFRASVRLNPESAENHFNLGTALAAVERFDQAAGEFQAALALNPGYAKARFNLGGALASMGRYDDAIAQFREIVQTEPGAAEAIEECLRLKSEGLRR